MIGTHNTNGMRDDSMILQVRVFLIFFSLFKYYFSLHEYPTAERSGSFQAERESTIRLIHRLSFSFFCFRLITQSPEEMRLKDPSEEEMSRKKRSRKRCFPFSTSKFTDTSSVSHPFLPVVFVIRLILRSHATDNSSPLLSSLFVRNNSCHHNPVDHNRTDEE